MGKEKQELKEEIAYFMRRLYNRGLTTTSGGNLSVKTKSGTILITPSASDKARMQPDLIGEVNTEGNIIDAGEKFKPTIEMHMHLAVYKARPDIYAIVHAHPIMCSVFAASNAEINTHMLSESYAIIGKVGYIEYACMGTKSLAVLVEKSVKDYNCLIMRNHGALTVGTTLLQAFDRLEILEAAAHVTYLTRFMNRSEIKELSRDNLTEIDEMMGR